MPFVKVRYMWTVSLYQRKQKRSKQKWLLAKTFAHKVFEECPLELSCQTHVLYMTLLTGAQLKICCTSTPFHLYGRLTS
uniref:Uncharacterized protein n=1 Tax=Anguilla anguilla TaxID=7936 RepID=A0A0E9UQ41_ANGAN